MEARTLREIKDGREFDKYFPEPDGTDTTVKKEADVEETMKLIQQTVPRTLWQTKAIAKKLKGHTLEETCNNIWHFVYEHIAYKRDKDGVEQVRSPRRTWWERRSGVDCDCYTEFISSILLNLGIPHKARVTKYPKRPPEVPRWQHVYPVVPLDGRIDDSLEERDSYIVLDCVKDGYDEEQPFLERKDYDMQLDFLDGIEAQEQTQTEEFIVPETADAQDMASLYDEEELGKIGDWLKKTVKKVGTAVKTAVKKVGDAAGTGIRFINRYVNPATVLLRNGFLLAMKNNMFNVSGKLRYAYLTDEQAKKMNINPASLKKLRSVKDRAETVYWQAGGLKSNLKKAILNGKGNRDKKVSVSGLYGTEDVYADMDEYQILHSDGMNGLGEFATGAALAAASGAVAAIKTALSQIKDLFDKNSTAAKAFDSNDENAIVENTSASTERKITTTPTTKQKTTTANSNSSGAAVPGESALPATASPDGSMVTTDEEVPEGDSSVPAKAEGENGENGKQGLIQKTTNWVKQNPGKSILLAGAVAGGSYLLAKALRGESKTGTNGLSGLEKNKGSKSRKRKKKRDRKKKHQKRKQKIQSIKL